MKLLASITVATAAANSFFAPNNKGYSSLEEAKAACEEKGGSVASGDDLAIAGFISSTKFLTRKKFFILQTSADSDITYVDSSDLTKAINKKKKAVTICKENKKQAKILAPCTLAGVSSRRALEDGDYIIKTDQAINFGDARKACKTIGKNWDLAIFNYEREHERITQIINENCVAHHAYWVGYKEYSGEGETVYEQELLLKKDGFTTSIELPWDVTSNMANPEPNDNLGIEECVRMKDGLMNDALCSRTWTGAQHEGVNMGYICERHNPCEDRRSGTSFDGYVGTDYIIEKPSYISANGAAAACQAIGAGWNLVVIDDVKENIYINSKITDGCSPYWTGMTEKDGITLDLDGNAVQYSDWDTHLGHGFNTNPGTPFNSETDCIRIRGGLYNDAGCDVAHGFTAKEKMGYICEFKSPIVSDDECLECKHNAAVLPWNPPSGCRAPNCDAKLGIVDAWKIGNGKSRPVRYGFIGLIKVPEAVIDNNEEFSVLIRFSKRITHGSFQLWNMKFWNFYNGGYEVLIHSKYWNTDRHDPYSVGFVAEDLNADEYPELLFWTGREERHQCFQPNMHHGQRTSQKTSFEAAFQTSNFVDGDFTKVIFKNGQIKLKGGKKSRQSQQVLL